MDFVYAGLGLIILLLAGDALVRGAVNLALRLGISALIVSLTVVSFGTSAPELVISVDAVLSNSPGIALGNVVGSNIANVLLVLGVPALFAGMSFRQTETKRSYLSMLSASVIFITVCFLGPLTLVHGLLLLAVLSLVMVDQFSIAMKQRVTEAPEGADPSMPGWRIALFLALGLVGLPLGAEIFVDSAVSIATRFGVSETVIGLTLVALGTSLPELATTVVAAIRRQAEVALGNVIGSNIFNILAIIGAASLFGSIPVDPHFLSFNLWIMLGASLLLAPFVLMRRDMGRMSGVLFTALYVAYIVWVLS
ncbi:K+-dependent Na+/Ca+ exchanger related-protein [Candidatus Rhodobacter oscarellae]|uniref:K+-dependent Na+/Ca+ exchanger related-protein n=1 Tax=Candidatus Rhodobacter oscarellae TaxID=1675527 RepID=A0A0J9E0R6_9RHOB|nr:calcium/sodium antiporter [Candidatus Rhodobacter lobularis]KMW56252.1 K+-dependent Na+/Ca+ exchanger related-protein [Candidatus Rhodobacter lobularis]